ncbi:MAG: hypothetical protein QNJ07_15575 [Woeseiaceae bacterium]|nr:hypothetical protein [Woeseiaceae bacterium]
MSWDALDFAVAAATVRRIALVLLALLVCGNAFAEKAALFSEHEILDVTLSGPVFRTIKDTRERTERPFVLSADGRDHKVMVRVRGKSRVKLCHFPPLRLKFSSQDTAGSVFEGQRKVKLVSHCNSGARATDAVLREYAAYRIFTLLSDASYQVRLLRIQYEDTESGSKRRGVGSPQYAFLLEPTAALGARVGGTRLTVPGVSLASLDDRQEALVYVFQYLIGNIDWSLARAEGDDRCCHNGDLIDLPHTRYVVPYDFDLSRFVHASYKSSRAAVRLRNVPYREYKGYCLPEATLRDALRAVTGKRNEILAVVEALPLLSARQSARSLDYLTSFFEKARDEEKLLQDFSRKCQS